MERKKKKIENFDPKKKMIQIVFLLRSGNHLPAMVSEEDGKGLVASWINFNTAKIRKASQSSATPIEVLADDYAILSRPLLANEDHDWAVNLNDVEAVFLMDKSKFEVMAQKQEKIIDKTLEKLDEGEEWKKGYDDDSEDDDPFID